MNKSDSDVKTVADIARLAGVSPSTASRALRDSPLISQETKARVRQIAAEHGYRPHRGARNLRLKRSNTVVLIIPLDIADEVTMSDPFVLKFLGEVGLALRDRGFDLLLSHLNFVDRRIDDDYFHTGLADGAILLGRGGSEQGHEASELLQETGVPFVVWGPEHPEQEYCSVGIDNVAAGADVVHHLVRHGRKRIAIIADALEEERQESYLRYQGYRKGLEANGLPFDETLVEHASFSPRSGETAVRRLLQRGAKFDALFVAYSDAVAVAALRTLCAAGRRVPEDIAVVGFDNIPLGAYTWPSLTTVSQRLRDGGAALLVEKLLQLVAGQEAAPVMLPGRLIVRQSCGARPIVEATPNGGQDGRARQRTTAEAD